MAKSKCRWDLPQDLSKWNAFLSSGLHDRNRWRLGVLLIGMLMLFAGGRQTVTSWLRAAKVSDDYQDYYYFLECVGRKCKSIFSQLLVLVLKTIPLPQRLLLVIENSHTRRYGPKIEVAEVHHNPTPSPADQPFLYGHVWVTISLAVCHTQWGSLALTLRRCCTFASRRWRRFLRSVTGTRSPPSSCWQRVRSSGPFPS